MTARTPKNRLFCFAAHSALGSGLLLTSAAFPPIAGLFMPIWTMHLMVAFGDVIND